MVSALILLLGGIFGGSLVFFWNLACGVIIGGANFVLLVWIVVNLCSGEGVNKRKVLVSFIGKALLLWLIISLILHQGRVSPLPFLLGLSNIFLGIVVYGIWDWVLGGQRGP